MTGSILDHPTPTASRASDPAAEQAQRDSECVAFFVALVTAAVVMLGLSLFTGVEGLLRLALTAGAGLLAGAVAWATARPVLEDDASGD
ncbi:hypothetical protein [Micrococcus luteus]|uniref:hypothetical protein n=1 Tax=Micrococcus luteus TaxID=1270 RepID=UPI000448F599|nr:hypothetical protein [Micrococcus luteus]EZP42188.1 hypothetical protein BW36_00807 [Micrococcus luteus]EZP42725.1 hypothetical protein BW35_00540 [Micrococcus luteus]MCD0181152.1 hypothetical protein [Micrococcus luteus]MCV7528988.1 hypothetical protein [Micrococcus luteus]MCV7537653.1 hypothetical protein [Micrococcus luteus]